MFIKLKNTRKIVSMMMLISIITTQIACSKANKNEIVNKFSDLYTMLPSEDLTTLYDKDCDKSNLPSGDKGTYVVNSQLITENQEVPKLVGINLLFNRNTRNVDGKFYIGQPKNETTRELTTTSYEISYDKDGFNLIDENIDEAVKEEFTNFKTMYDSITLDRAYLDSLKSTKIDVLEEDPSYEIRYELTSHDTNIKKIKELYPNLHINDKKLELILRSSGSLNKLASYIKLDETDDTCLSYSIHLTKSDSFN